MSQKIHFHKYQGAGNDFIMVDNRNGEFPVNNHSLVHKLCDRHFGIGADGMILLEEKEGKLSMIYYNADGQFGSMCGNGGRSFVRFVSDLGLMENHCEFVASDGNHEASLDGKIIQLKMSDAFYDKTKLGAFFIDTGSPHQIVMSSDLENEEVFNKGRELRFSDKFKSIGGTNVNFVKTTGNDSIFVRTYERGVENETLACGTGAVASAIISFIHGEIDSTNVKVKVLGGDLEVDFIPNEDNTILEEVYLTGPAEKVFEGTILI